jgi:maltose alpha-D-glucosyltransferase/alpha-amylase
VLWSEDRWFVTDFEGEPDRSIADRRRKASPLRDVAGMLRSFAYAAATAQRERPDDASVRERADAWERGARTALLDTYFAGAVAAYLPSNRSRAEALLRLFELEKAFYELQYELRNRPDWVGIPLDGIRRLRRADRGIGA